VKKQIVFLCLALFSFLFLPFSASADSYTVGYGDVLKITVYNHPDLETKVSVNDSGQILMPLLGHVAVKGKTIGEISDLLAVKLADGYIVSPQINVFIEAYGSKCYVTGEVVKPDAYVISDDTTVIKVITLAGGFTGKASRGGVSIIRKDGDKEIVMTDAPLDTFVKKNDVVVVLESFF